MIWIVIAVVLVAGSVGLTHRALREWWPSGRPVVSTGLVYAAAVVVGAHITSLAANITMSHDTTFTQVHDDDLMLRTDVQMVASSVADTAWQAGLLLALAVLVAGVAARREPV